jgi:hypothetical protein
VNIFADGYSNIKTILFFVYLLGLGLIYLLFRKKQFKKLKWWYFSITILTMYFYGLFLQVFYTISNNLPWGRMYVTGNNGEISLSSILHSHISKAVIGVIFPHLNNIDIGIAYLNSFPGWIFLFGSILLLIILFQVIIYFITSFRIILQDMERRSVWVYIFAYATISFSLVKTSIDGGIFHPAFLVSFIFLIIFILQNKNKLPNYHYYLSAFVALILLFINRQLNHLAYGSGVIFIQAAALILFYNLVLYCGEKKIIFWKLGLFILLFLVGWRLHASHDLGIYKYSKISITSGNNAYYYNKNKEEISLLKAVPGQTILQLSKELNKNIYYLPVAVSGKTCRDDLAPRKIRITLITEKFINKNFFINSVRQSDLSIYNNESSMSGKNWRTELIIHRESCLPEGVSVIDGILRKNGINTYIYYNFLGL